MHMNMHTHIQENKWKDTYTTHYPNTWKEKKTKKKTNKTDCYFGKYSGLDENIFQKLKYLITWCPVGTAVLVVDEEGIFAGGNTLLWEGLEILWTPSMFGSPYALCVSLYLCLCLCLFPLSMSPSFHVYDWEHDLSPDCSCHSACYLLSCFPFMMVF